MTTIAGDIGKGQAVSRQLRMQFPGAIYHVTSRGDRRRSIVVDDTDRDYFYNRIGKTVEKYGWQMFAAALMTNHFHLFFRTPQPNLSRGMQFLLGGYASCWNRRHCQSGHVFQGRFRGHLIEDETYFWAVSRYVHLNPVPVLVDHPKDWAWSSYVGYVNRSCRLPWIDYQTLLAAWQGSFGGTDVIDHYRSYVEASISSAPASPFGSAIDGWILGSEKFAKDVRQRTSPASREPTAEKFRRREGTLCPHSSAGCQVHHRGVSCSSNSHRLRRDWASADVLRINRRRLLTQVLTAHRMGIENKKQRLTPKVPKVRDGQPGRRVQLRRRRTERPEYVGNLASILGDFVVVGGQLPIPRIRTAVWVRHPRFRKRIAIRDFGPCFSRVV